MLVPDPRASDNQGVSFEVVSKAVLSLAGINKDASWIDEYSQIKTQAICEMEALESCFYHYSVEKETVRVTPAAMVRHPHKLCICPLDFQKNCSFNKLSQCVSYKHFVGRTAPKGYAKNKFLVLKNRRIHSYKFVQDHLPTNTPFYSVFKQLK